MLKNRSAPGSIVIPVLAYPDIGEAVAWLCEVFGFSLRLLIANHRAQLNVGTGHMIVAAQGAEAGKAFGGHAVMVRLEDVDSHHQHALQLGARVLQPPTSHPYGERQYSVLDLAEHKWIFTQSVADVNPTDWGGTPFDL